MGSNVITLGLRPIVRRWPPKGFSPDFPHKLLPILTRLIRLKLEMRRVIAHYALTSRSGFHRESTNVCLRNTQWPNFCFIWQTWLSPPIRLKKAGALLELKKEKRLRMTRLPFAIMEPTPSLSNSLLTPKGL